MYSVNPAEVASTTAAIPSCSAVGPSFGGLGKAVLLSSLDSGDGRDGDDESEEFMVEIEWR